MKTILLLTALVAGMLGTLQAGLNTKMGKSLGDPVYAALISFCVGTLTLFLYSLVVRVDFSAARQASSLHWVYWGAGCLGAFFVASTIMLTPKLGAALTFSLLVAGQMIMALFIDHLGLFDIPAHPVNWLRVAGIALVMAGVILIRKF